MNGNCKHSKLVAGAGQLQLFWDIMPPSLCSYVPHRPRISTTATPDETTISEYQTQLDRSGDAIIPQLVGVWCRRSCTNNLCTDTLNIHQMISWCGASSKTCPCKARRVESAPRSFHLWLTCSPYQAQGRESLRSEIPQDHTVQQLALMMNHSQSNTWVLSQLHRKMVNQVSTVVNRCGAVESMLSENVSTTLHW